MCTRLYLYPDIVQLTVKHPQHTDAAGSHVHGCRIANKGVKHLHGPSLSQTMKDWVRTKLLDGCTTQQIIAQHTKSALPRIEDGTADRDCFLSSQDIRNIAHKLARLTWKLHDNEAQSVRLFYQEHSEYMFLYEEEHAGQPPAVAQGQPAISQQQTDQQQHADSAQQAGNASEQPPQMQQPQQKFVMGWATQFMMSNMLKYGNNNIILLDATFGTNHMKMPLYTGLVIDEFGNGLPAFEVLCQGSSQLDVSKWLTALLQHVRQKDPDWMCSCVMVDDAIAEINAIK